MLPKAHAVHESKGRLRVRVPSQKGNPAYFQHARERLSQIPDVSSVKVNPVTGSILVSHNTANGAIAAFAVANDLFELEAKAERILKATVQEATLTVYRTVDEGVKRATGGELDLAITAYLALIGTGIYQIARGRFRAVPWHTAMWYGMNLFMESQKRKAESSIAVGGRS